MQYEYTTKGTCSRSILFEIEDGKLKNVQYIGGCGICFTALRKSH